MMLKTVLCLLLTLQTIAAPLTTPNGRVTFAMKTGILLRVHVIAQDDTAEMQRIKTAVRDAVRQVYDERHPTSCLPMLAATEAMLPDLTEAAVAAARREGFEGNVDVSIETRAFDARELDGFLLPGGEYPALMIRMGDAQGHNWWGLIDPDFSLQAATVPGSESSDGSTLWDWSLKAFLSALLSLPWTSLEGSDA